MSVHGIMNRSFVHFGFGRRQSYKHCRIAPLRHDGRRQGGVAVDDAAAAAAATVTAVASAVALHRAAAITQSTGRTGDVQVVILEPVGINGHQRLQQILV